MIVANSKDLTASILILVLAIIPIATGIPQTVLDVVETNPIQIKAVCVGLLLLLLYKKYTLTAIVLVVMALVIRFEVFGSYVYSHDGIMAEYSAEQRRDPRFNKNTNVDLQIAEGTLVKDPARWLDKGRKRAPLLLFPPTLDQLQMIGNNGRA
jgi:hypothetical protein